jgi:hypothetical protein
VAISGITAGQTLVGIDIRPANGLLYGLGVNATTDVATLYTISTTTGAASAVGSIPDGIGIDFPAGDYGFDFNPNVDRIRVTEASGLNLRINPNNGSLAGHDTNMVGAAISGVAYTNNQAGASVTTLYTLDATGDQLMIQNGNTGLQTAVGPLGVDFSAVPGFDIAPGIDVASNNGLASGSGMALLTVGGINSLYSINLASGAATLVGSFLNGMTTASGFTINVPPLIVSNGGGDTASLSVAENSTAVTTVQATDDQTLSYSIAGGADQARFQINSTTGALSFISAPDFENPTDADHNNSYIVQVRASDGSLFDEQIITVNVTNVNGAPTIISNGGGDTANVSIAENAMAVTTVVAADPDAATTLVFSIIGGADQAKFQINGATGVLSFIAAPDFENPTDSDHNNSYIVQVRASDGSLSDDQTITVNVTDANEAITIARPVDFNADGKDDLLWRLDNGGVASWTFNAGKIAGSPSSIGSAPLSTIIEGTGDFNGDGRGDILFRSTDGHIAEWLMNGNQLTAARDTGTINATWR